MRYLALLFAVALALHGGASAAAPARLNALALSLANGERAAAGRQALRPSEALDRAAQAHAEDMLRRNYHAHVTPEGRSARDRFLRAGGERRGKLAENIAMCWGCEAAGETRVQSFHHDWMGSRGHRRNILAHGLERFGFGIASADGRTYAVEMFAGPGGEAGTRMARR